MTLTSLPHLWIQFVENNAGKLVPCRSECGDDLFHGVVDIETEREHGYDAVGLLEKLAIGGAERQRRSVQNREIMASGRARAPAICGSPRLA
jgi:hypothetical protein